MVRNRYEYDTFGETELVVEEEENSIRYAGEMYDASTGQYYLRARYYAPDIGRFTSADRYAGKTTDPASLNLYTYCGNDPVNYTDPSGHSRESNLASVEHAWEYNYISYEEYAANVRLNGGVPKANTRAKNNAVYVGRPKGVMGSVSEFESLSPVAQNRISSAYDRASAGKISVSKYMDIVQQNGGSLACVSPKLASYSGDPEMEAIRDQLALDFMNGLPYNQFPAAYDGNLIYDINEYLFRRGPMSDKLKKFLELEGISDEKFQKDGIN